MTAPAPNPMKPPVTRIVKVEAFCGTCIRTSPKAAVAVGQTRNAVEVAAQLCVTG